MQDNRELHRDSVVYLENSGNHTASIPKKSKGIKTRIAELKGRSGRWWKEFKKDLKNKSTALLFFILSGMCFWLLMVLLNIFWGFDLGGWLKGIPFLYTTFSHFVDEISARSNAGIFYVFAISSLFFLPIPLEALYINFLREGFGFQELFFLAVGGIIAGQIINYLFGRFFKFIFMQFIKKKTRLSMKRKLVRYGPVAVTSVHLIPFPFQLFNFISGMLKYSFIKWIFFMTLGLALKHVIMYWIYIQF